MGERENINTVEYWNAKLQRIATRGSWRTSVYNFLLDVLPKEEEFSLLDVGCALGDGLALLRKHFPRADLSGLDFSDVGIQIAKKRHPDIKFICADILTYSFERKYDYVTVVRTLEHFVEPFKVLDKCLSATNRCVYVNVPSPKVKVREHVYKFYPDSFSNYVVKDLTKKESVGHEIVLAVYSKKEA